MLGQQAPMVTVPAARDMGPQEEILKFNAMLATLFLPSLSCPVPQMDDLYGLSGFGSRESLSLGPAEAPVGMSSVRPLGLTHKSSLQVRGTDLLTSAFVAAPTPLPCPSRLQISLDSDNTSPFPFSWRDAHCLQLLLVPGSSTIPSCFFIAWPHLCIAPSLKFFFH